MKRLILTKTKYSILKDLLKERLEAKEKELLANRSEYGKYDVRRYAAIKLRVGIFEITKEYVLLDNDDIAHLIMLVDDVLDTSCDLLSEKMDLDEFTYVTSKRLMYKRILNDLRSL